MILLVVIFIIRTEEWTCSNGSLAHLVQQSILTVTKNPTSLSADGLQRKLLEGLYCHQRYQLLIFIISMNQFNLFLKPAKLVASITSYANRFQSLIMHCVKKCFPFVYSSSSSIQFHWATSCSSILEKGKELLFVHFIHTLHGTLQSCSLMFT